jgi:hypothetical protein
MPNPPHLAPQQRPQALAELQPLIAKAERDRNRCRRALELLEPGSGPADLRRARAYLHIAENRLAELCRSREVLIGGEDQTAAEEQPEAS